MTDPRSLSRRKLLWALTTVGAAASTGGGAAALLSDSEPFGESTVSAGVVDLETDPSWGNDDSLGTISTGESGSRETTIELTDSSNPSYIWFRTECKQCVEVEDALYVKYGVDTDGDGSVETSITDGYISLREARDQFGAGEFVGTLEPDDQWTLVAEWELRELIEDTDVSLSFDFYATQTRHVSDPNEVSLPWSCVDCGDPTGGPDGNGVAGISWVAFCDSSDFDGNFTPELDGDNTLLLATDAYSISDTVETVAIKYGQTIEVFSDIQNRDSLTVGIGDGNTYQRVNGQGDTYEGTARSSSNFCNGEAGCKYEFPDETDGGWEDCTDGNTGVDSGSGGSYGNNQQTQRIGTGLSNDRLGGER